MRNLLFVFTILLILVFQSCSNKEKEFSDFEYQSVYFSYQYPVRTITLGEDFVNTTLDNEHRFQVMATLGGVYSNDNDVTINFVVDTTICAGYRYENGTAIKYLPESYYQLASNTMVIPAGKVVGGVMVQLTDAFFTDTLAIATNYVLPIRMVSVENADTILSGKPFPLIVNPRRLVTTDWEIQPKDYVLYAVKYVNPWHGYYLRRGTDSITKDGVASSAIRHSKYVENDEVCLVSTLSLTTLQFPLKEHKNKLGHNLNFRVKLNFDENQNCIVSPIAPAYNVNDTVRVYNIVTNGNGRFVKGGETNSWGNKDRDAIYVHYNINYDIEIRYPKRGLPTDIQQVTYSTTDTLVLRNRGVGMETFKVLQ